MPEAVWQILKYKVHAMTGNGNYVNLLTLSQKIASIELIIGRFLPFGTAVWHVWACCGFNLLLMAGN